MKLAKYLLISCLIDYLLIEYFSYNKVSILIRKYIKYLWNNQMLFYFPPLRKNGMAISGRARIAIVALIGRYMPKFT